MEKRYQVFVSSTYEDLKVERQTVMHALLELDCIPAGMELFPAADDDQWSLIKSVINDCDYYVLILGGRYGSIGPDSVGYTEKEYRYALETGKPIVAFTHRNPGTIAAQFTEQTDDGKRKLAEFCELVRKKMCKAWETPDELAGVVSRSLLRLIKSSPAVGWIRGDTAADATEVLALKRKIEALEGKLVRLSEEPPEGTEDLSQGEDIYYIKVRFETHETRDGKTGTWIYRINWEFSWNEFLECLGPAMLNDANQSRLRQILKQEVERQIEDAYNAELREITEFDYEVDPFDRVIIQLRALGLVKNSDRTRSVSDHNTYWSLTPLGDRRLTELMAIRKDDEEEEDEDEEEEKENDGASESVAELRDDAEVEKSSD